jgi:hypothetical protein
VGAGAGSNASAIAGAGGGAWKRVFVVALAAALVALTTYLLYLRGAAPTFVSADVSTGGGEGAGGEGSAGPLLTIAYDAGEDTEFRLHGQYVAECTRDSFCLYDRNGVEAFKKNIDFLKPAMRQQGKYLLVFDVGGRDAFLMNGKKLVWEDAFESNVVNASVSRGGQMAVVLESSGYRNSVRVMAPVGRRLFDWVVADDYVLSAEAAPGGDGVLVNRLKTGGVVARGALEFLDMSSAPVATLLSGEGDVFLEAWYLQDGSFAAFTAKRFAWYAAPEAGAQGGGGGGGDAGGAAGGGAGADEAAAGGGSFRELAWDEYDAVMAACEFPAKKATVAAIRGGAWSVLQYDGKDTTAGGTTLLSPGQPILNMAASGDGAYLLVNMGTRVAVLDAKGAVALDQELASEAVYGCVAEAGNGPWALVVSRNRAELYARAK